MSRSVRALLVVPGLLLLAAPLAAAETYTFQSRFYKITTDADRDTAREIARHMDTMHNAYQRRFADFPRRQARRPDLHVYERKADYVEFLADRGIPGAATGGIFFVKGNESALATYLEGQPRARMLNTLRHEGFHQFAEKRIGRSLPVWANEGMAEYFAESIPVGGRLRTGQVPPNRLKRLRQRIEEDEHIPFERLMTLSNEAWRARLRSENGPVQYDQAWSIVHFLVNGNRRYRQAFLQYLGKVAQGGSHRRAYKQTFGGGSYGAFEKAWRRYMLDLEPTPEKTAAERLRFLGHGIKMLHEEGETVESIGQLKEALRKVRFRVTQTIGHGFSIKRSAEDDALFAAPEPRNPQRSPKLTLEPAEEGSGLPPGAVVRGLGLTVRLRWIEGPTGEEPISRIEYE